MKLFFASAIIIFFLITTSYKSPLVEAPAFTNPTKQEVVYDLAMQAMQRLHYQPAIIDDEFSKKAYVYYLDILDRNKRFFYQSDIDKFKEYELLIDDGIREHRLDFFTLCNSTITKRMEEIEGSYKDILANPFDYSLNEMIETDSEKLKYPHSNKERMDRWRVSLKFSTISRIVNKINEQEKAKEKNDTLVLKTFEELEVWAREKVTKSYDNFFKRVDKIKPEERFADYINALVHVFDPHTGYYPPKEKDNFDIYMSGQLEGIGAQLQQKDGMIKVTRIVPGSASWKQGELKAGDIIMSVAQGDKETVDITDMRLDEAVLLIRGKKGTEVRLTVKKIDGTVTIIPIIRDVVEMEETYAKSTVVERDIKVGYLKLPKFYIDLANKGGRSCAEDVKKEITKLTKEGIDGLVFDLRNNGGGSLQDAVKIAGFFIEKGPVVQIKSRMSAPYVMNDKDPSILYDGPLVVLVNSFSISASEIVSAALQDYKRAVIVGSEATYGKGTVQRFFNLDNYISGGPDGIKPLGSIKMTTQKFYRINGGATQLEGVYSDIFLPNNYAYMDLGEREIDHHLEWDKIQPAEYSLANKTNGMTILKSKSDSRIKENKSFQLIESNAKRLKIQDEKSSYSLNYKVFKAENDSLEETAKKFKEIGKDTTDLIVHYFQGQLESLKSDTSKFERIKDWHKQLKKDIHLYESVSILNDMQAPKN